MKIPDYGDVMTLEEFVEAVKRVFFTNDDGSGYYSDGLEYDHKSKALPSEIYKGNVDRSFTHVVWFNK